MQNIEVGKKWLHGTWTRTFKSIPTKELLEIEFQPIVLYLLILPVTLLLLYLVTILSAPQIITGAIELTKWNQLAVTNKPLLFWAILWILSFSTIETMRRAFIKNDTRKILTYGTLGIIGIFTFITSWSVLYEPPFA